MSVLRTVKMYEHIKSSFVQGRVDNAPEESDTAPQSGPKRKLSCSVHCCLSFVFFMLLSINSTCCGNITSNFSVVCHPPSLTLVTESSFRQFSKTNNHFFTPGCFDFFGFTCRFNPRFLGAAQVVEVSAFFRNTIRTRVWSQLVFTGTTTSLMILNT